MTIFSDFRSGDFARLSQQWIGLRSSFEGSGLNAIRAITRALLRNECVQDAAFVIVQDQVPIMRQRDADLNGVFEAELAR